MGGTLGFDRCGHIKGPRGLSQCDYSSVPYANVISSPSLLTKQKMHHARSDSCCAIREQTRRTLFPSSPHGLLCALRWRSNFSGAIAINHRGDRILHPVRGVDGPGLLDSAPPPNGINDAAGECNKVSRHLVSVRAWRRWLGARGKSHLRLEAFRRRFYPNGLWITAVHAHIHTPTLESTMRGDSQLVWSK